MKTTDKKNILYCKNITKTYGIGEAKVLALRGVNLAVYKNEMLMLVGPSGCGKTTLVSCMSGLLKYDSGLCHILGKDLSKMSEDEIVSFRGKHIGFVFQSFNLLPALNSVENVALPLTIAGVKNDIAYKKAKDLLSEVGLESKFYVKPKQLSGGQKQRVAVARALVHEPDLIICDEPTSSLDHDSGQSVMELLQKMKNQNNRTIIIVTHDDRIYKYGDTMAYMEDGKIVKVERKTQ